VAQNERRPGGSALDLRTTNWAGYAVSQRVRKRAAYLLGAAYNLLRIAKLCPSG
jgi:hypothetical protein